MIVLYVIVEYFCGSLMFSYWLARLVNRDLTKVGDGNPGAFNLWHAAGYKLGLTGVVLDFLKGYFPLVLLLKHGSIQGMEVIPVALAPILGHIFSPFLGFQGGKAIAVTFGVWSALTQFRVSLVYAIILAALFLAGRQVSRGKPFPTEVDGLMVVFGLALVGIYLFSQNYPGYLILIWLCNLILLRFTNRAKLRRLAREMDEKYQVKEFLTRFHHPDG